MQIVDEKQIWNVVFNKLFHFYGKKLMITIIVGISLKMQIKNKYLRARTRYFQSQSNAPRRLHYHHFWLSIFEKHHRPLQRLRDSLTNVPKHLF